MVRLRVRIHKRPGDVLKLNGGMVTRIVNDEFEAMRRETVVA